MLILDRHTSWGPGFFASFRRSTRVRAEKLAPGTGIGHSV